MKAQALLHYGSVFGLRLAAAAMQAGILMILAGSLGPYTFGVLASAQSLTLVLITVVSGGLPTRVLRLNASMTESRAFSVTLNYLSSAVLAVVAIVSISCAAIGYAEAYLVGALLALADSFTQFAQNLLFGEARNLRATTTSFASRAAGMSLVCTAAATEGPLLHVCAIYSALSLAISMAGIGKHPRTSLNFRQNYREGYQYWRSSVWAVLQQLDITLVAALAGKTAGGGYAAAFRLAAPMHLVTSTMVSLAVPQLSRENDQPSTRARVAMTVMNSGYLYGAIIVLASPATFYFGPRLLGSSYSDWAWMFPILFVNGAISVVNQVRSALLFADDKARQVAHANRLSVIAGLLGIGGCALLGHPYGAAICTALIQVLLFVLLPTPSFLSKKRTHEANTTEISN